MSSLAPSEPSMVGPFVVRALLQKGPPRVMRAFDPRMNREVRLKLYARSEDDAEQSRSVAAAHAAMLNVRHPAIVPAYEVGIADHSVYVVGELPAGKRLVEFLADRPLPQRRAVVVTRALAEGMAVAHERGLVHGNIHPGGVILDSDGGAGWLDFGALSQSPPTNPIYCAPERLGDPPGPADAASDQYGLGVLLFEMLTGQTPFSGDDAEVVAEVLMADRAPSVRGLDSKFDRNLDAICRKAMSPLASQRYPTCQELADDLRRWLEGASVTARPPSRMSRLVTNSKVLIGLVLACLLGIAALAVLLIVQKQQSQADAAAARRASAPNSLSVNPEPNRLREPPNAQRVSTELRERERELTDLRVRSMQTENKLREEKSSAEEGRKTEAKARSDLEANLYCELIRRSHEFWLERDLDRATSYLHACEPTDKKRPDLRNWEWHFLHRRFQPPKTFTLNGADAAFANLEPRAADGTDLRTATCAYSPDGHFLVHCLRDDHAVVWNTLIGDSVLATERQRGAVCDVVFSPDGAHVATSGADKIVTVWQSSSGERVRTLRGHDDAVTAAAYRPDGRKLATGGADHVIMIWNLGEDGSKLTLKGHDSAVLGVAFRPDGKLLASCDAGGAIKLWDAEDGKIKHELGGHTGRVGAVAFSPDGQRLASAGADRTVRLWDVNSGKEIRTLAGHIRGVRSVAFRPDGKQLASAGDDRTVCLWDSSGNLLSTFLTGHTDAIHRITYRADSRQFATASLDQSIKIWDANRPVSTDGRVLSGHTDAAMALVISPDGKQLASGGADKTVRIWDSQTGEMLRMIEGHSAAVRGLAFSPDSTRLASCAEDGAIKIWDAATGQPMKSFGGHTGAVNGVAFSPDGSLLASAGTDGAVRIRESATGKLLINCNNHVGGAIGVAFTRDGKRILTSGGDGAAHFWDVQTGEVVVGIMERTRTLKLVAPPGAKWRDGAAAVMGYPARVAFSVDGERCAIVSSAGLIQVFDMKTVLPIVWMEGHDQTIQSLTFTPDGRRLVTGDVTGTVKMWDCRTGLEVLKLNAHAGRVAGLAFSRDGRLLFSAGADRVIRIWDGTPIDPNAKPPQGDDTAGNGAGN